MYTLIVEFSHTNYAYPWRNTACLMPDGSVLVLVMFPLLGCFLAYQVGENHLCMSHRQSQFGHFSGYQSKKCVNRNT